MDYRYVTAINQSYQTLALTYSCLHHERESVNIPDETPTISFVDLSMLLSKPPAIMEKEAISSLTREHNSQRLSTSIMTLATMYE